MLLQETVLNGDQLFYVKYLMWLFPFWCDSGGVWFTPKLSALTPYCLLKTADLGIFPHWQAVAFSAAKKQGAN